MWQWHVGNSLSALLLHTLPVFWKDICPVSTQILPTLLYFYIMSSSEASQNLIHPIETFQYSTNYPQFEAVVIHPFLHAAQAQSTLFPDIPLEFSAAPNHLSIEDIIHFL